MSWFTDSKFAFCRGVANHAWHFPPSMEFHGRQLMLTLKCDNCGTKRLDGVSAFNGEVAARNYDYPDGYLLDLGGKRRPEKHILRRDGLQLLMEEFGKHKIKRAKVVPLRRKRRKVA